VGTTLRQPSETNCAERVHLDTQRGFSRVVGKSTRMAQVVAKARRLAGVDASVLLHGETGVGKEVFARAIHEHGPYRLAPFIALNCGGVPRELLASELFGYVDGAFTGARKSGMSGKVEAAQGGTLFLDEIAELPLDLQPYLLRVLEGGEVCPLGSTRPRSVRFRLIAACNRDLRREIEAQRFRVDLFYRVSVTSLHIPPLRERKEDLPTLVDHFANMVAQRYASSAKRFTPEVLHVFERYTWPGNLRELRNVVEAMTLMSDGDEVNLASLPIELLAPARPHAQEMTPPVPSFGGLRHAERETVETAIRMHAGNLTLVARDLGISRSTLYLKLRKHGLEHGLAEARARTS
jgi:sigma-54 dependent transcriptional regulator, acetoin dehydrogenase operon transcriptional activator AcoR